LRRGTDGSASRPPKLTGHNTGNSGSHTTSRKASGSAADSASRTSDSATGKTTDGSTGKTRDKACTNGRKAFAKGFGTIAESGEGTRYILIGTEL
jgi:hypothetical protein